MKSGLRQGLRKFFLLSVLVPLVLLGLVEAAIRIAGVDTQTIASRDLAIRVPVWSYDELDFFTTEVAWRHILEQDVPVESAEWMACFEKARHVRYKMKPDLSTRVSNTINRRELQEGVKVLFESNHEGFRTAPVPRRKGHDLYRVVLLGDSLTFGWGVDQDQRFSRFLEDRLNAEAGGARYEVINLGMPGYTLHHGLAAFEHYALAYEPDMVVVAFGINDARPIPVSAKRLLARGERFEALRYLLQRLETYNLMRRWLLASYDPFARVRAREQGTEPREPFVTPEEYRAGLTRLEARAREAGIETVLLEFFCREPYRRAHREVAAATGLSLVDGKRILLESIPAVQSGAVYPEWGQYYRGLYGLDFLEGSPLFYVTSDTLHPNALGHRIVADALFERLFADRLNRAE